jgi:hypothetical protein
MRETMLTWCFIDKETRVEEDHTQLERLREPADDSGKFYEMDRKS